MVEFDNNLNPMEPERPSAPPTPPPAPVTMTSRMERAASPLSPLLLAGLVVILLLLATGFGVYALTKNDSPTPVNPSGQIEGLNVTAEGLVFATPDIAKATLGVQKTGRTVAEVEATLSQTTDTIKTAVRKLGIEEKDIKTTDFNIYPQQDNNRIVGYNGRHSLTITVRDLSKVDGVTDTALQAGANEVTGVSFTVEDEEKWWQEARSQAITKAKEKAKKIAVDADIRLGRIISINEYSNQPIPYASFGRGGDVAVDKPMEVGLEPGNLEMRVNVTLVYDIL